MTRHLEAWKLSGRCATDPTPDAWFADDPAAVTHAKRVCGGCPVRDTCLADALTRGEPFGVLGGLSGQERRRAAVEGGYRRPSIHGAAQHGTNSMYIGGCRCEQCTRARARYVADWRTRRPVTRRAMVAVAVLSVPAGRGRHRAWPGQTFIEIGQSA